jgi:hypothetical protein
VIAGLAAALAGAIARPASARVTRILLGEAFLLLEEYLDLKPAQRDRFFFAYRAMRDKKPAPDAQARVVHRDGSANPLALDAAGWVTELPTLDQLKRRDAFEVDGPPFDMLLEMRATLAPAERLAVAELASTLAQANAAIVSFAGGDPSAGGGITCVYFPDAGSGKAQMPDGAERPLPAFDFPLIGVTPYFEAHSLGRAASVTLAKAPSRLVIAGPPRK